MSDLGQIFSPHSSKCAFIFKFCYGFCLGKYVSLFLISALIVDLIGSS